MDITIIILCNHKVKVNAFYVRFACYVFEQILLDYEFCVLSFLEILAWTKRKDRVKEIHR